MYVTHRKRAAAFYTSRPPREVGHKDCSDIIFKAKKQDAQHRHHSSVYKYNLQLRRFSHQRSYFCPSCCDSSLC